MHMSSRGQTYISGNPFGDVSESKKRRPSPASIPVIYAEITSGSATTMAALDIRLGGRKFADRLSPIKRAARPQFPNKITARAGA
jgi:hypothetical protein